MREKRKHKTKKLKKFKKVLTISKICDIIITEDKKRTKKIK